MKHFKKLNAKGFGHIEMIVAVVAIAVIGAAGSYVYLHKSSAATNYPGICGSGYSYNYTWPLAKYGKIVVYRKKVDATNYRLCAFTIRTDAAYGVRGTTTVKIGNKTPTASVDTGNYAYYAGPVYVTTPGGGFSVGGSVTYKGVVYK